MPAPINIYCCYHNNDQESWENLSSHLVVLKRNGQIVTFDCLNFPPGSNQMHEHDTRLVAADVVLLIISKYFLADDLCWNMMMQAMQRYQTGEVRVIPIRYRPIYYNDAPFANLSMLPKGNPISLWNEPDEAYENIAEGISELVQILFEERTEKNSLRGPFLHNHEQSKQQTVEPFETVRLFNIVQEVSDND